MHEQYILIITMIYYILMIKTDLKMIKTDHITSQKNVDSKDKKKTS